MSDWGTHPLGELCDVLDSKRKPITQRDREPGPFPYYGATGILDYVKDYIFDEKLVLIGEDGAKWGPNERSAFIAEGHYWVNNHAHVIRPHRDEVLDEWLVYYLNYADLSPFISGLTVPKLNQGQMRDIPIPVAPLPEQQRIVTKLDAAFGALREAEGHVERNRANARELFESYLNGVFEGKSEGWEEKSLQDICDVRDGTHDSPKYHDTGFALVTSKNLKPDGLDLENVSLISEEDFNEINRRSKVDTGDVLFAMIGTIGNPTVINDEPSFAIKNVALFKCGSALDGQFLRYALLTSEVKERMRKEAKGTTQRFVGLGYLRSFRIAVPALSEQRRIVTELDALNEKARELEATYQQKLRELEGLKKGLLGAAFRGEL